MADEIKKEMLNDAEVDGVAGGRYCVTDTTVGTKACATPGCKGRIPASSSERYCEKCIKKLPITGDALI